VHLVYIPCVRAVHVLVRAGEKQARTVWVTAPVLVLVRVFHAKTSELDRCPGYHPHGLGSSVCESMTEEVNLLTTLGQAAFSSDAASWSFRTHAVTD